MSLPVDLHPSSTQSLPISYRRLASIACKPDVDFDVLQRVLRYADVNRNAGGLLPIIYVHLNVEFIPPLHILALPVMPPEHEAAVLRAAASIRALFALDRPPDKALPRLWTRTFPWHRALCERQRKLEAQSSFQQMLDIYAFVDHLAIAAPGDGMQLVMNTEGFPQELIGDWNMLLGFVEQFPNHADGLCDALSLVTNHHCASPGRPEVLAQFVDGAGGSVAELANIIFNSLRYIAKRCARADVDGGTNTDASARAITALFSFILWADEASCVVSKRRSISPRRVFGDLLEELLPLGFIAILFGLAEYLHLVSPMGRLSAGLGACLSLVANIAGNTQGSRWLWLDEMVKHGLLRFIAKTGILLRNIEEKPLRLAAQHTGDFLDSALLVALSRRSFCEVVRSHLSPSSPIPNAKWLSSSPFAAVAKDHAALLDQLDEAPGIRACDNMQCAKLTTANVIRRCSSCRAVYYCSPNCQSIDWGRPGGHRQYCAAYWGSRICLSGSMLHRLPHSERLYIRALVHRDYTRHLARVFQTQISYLLSQEKSATPRGPLITLFDYTKHPLQIYASRDARRLEMTPEWADLVERASQLGGKYALHVVRVFDEGDPRDLLVPLRTDGIVDLVAEVERIAGVLQNVAEQDREVVIAREVAELEKKAPKMQQIH